MSKLRVPFAVLLLVLSACSRQDPAPPSPVPPAASPITVPALVTVETRGGMCPNGPCGSLITINSDGSVHELRPTDRLTGQVRPQLLEALRVEIDQANFPLIESRSFTDTCPMAYDGQETIYVFTVGQGTGFERIATCEIAIDQNHPLFRAVDAVIAAVGR